MSFNNPLPRVVFVGFNMEIQKCTQEDIDEVARFYDRVILWLKENINYPRWRYKEYPNREYVEDMTEEGSLYLCIDDDRLLGAFTLNEDPLGKYENAKWITNAKRGEYLVIHALAVAPEAQGKGVASRAIEYSTRYAKAGGYRSVRADIVPDNLPAELLFVKNGFVFSGKADLDRGLPDIPEFSLYEKMV